MRQVRTLVMRSRNKMFSYRVYPSTKQIKILDEQLSISRIVYNFLLDLRIKKYVEDKKTLGKYDLNKVLTQLKTEFPFLKSVHSQVLQNVSDRIQKAYDNFFRRVKEIKAGKKIKPGFPRFKSAKRYSSLTYPQASCFEIIGTNRLQVSKVGLMKIVLHRPINGEIKTMTIKKTPTGKWFAVFSCEVPFDAVKRHPNPEREIGVDVGLENFATLSDGTKIENPRFLIEAQDRLATLQRRLSKKKKGSKNRNAERIKVAKLHEKIANQRHDFSHKLSSFFTEKYGKIAVENLNILGMVKHPYLAKHINDASWGNFTRNLAYKAEEAGCEFVRVDPRGTSQDCSQCGTRVPKTLAQRWHHCPSCGLEMDRDLNAAKNILRKNASTFGTKESQACGDGSSFLERKVLEVSPSAKQEATVLVRW